MKERKDRMYVETNSVKNAKAMVWNCAELNIAKSLLTKKGVF